jgi:23S rRNA (adenine-N6)-dimethyltransferase
VAGRRHAPSRHGEASDGQHFLRSPALAAELVDDADIRSTDVVVEIGGGTGRLSEPLARRAGHLVVVERDPHLARLLGDRLAQARNVEVVCGNALDVPLPRRPFRVFGNLPFSFGTRILRRLLDDPTSAMERLDALVQFEVARKRAQIVPSTVVSIGWLPWWEFAFARRVHGAAFEPIPGVDAGMLRVTRRAAPLLAAAARPSFLSFTAPAFASPVTPVAISCRGRVSASAWARLASQRGLPAAARPADLDVSDWVALFSATGRRAAARRGRP